MHVKYGTSGVLVSHSIGLLPALLDTGVISTIQIDLDPHILHLKNSRICLMGIEHLSNVSLICLVEYEHDHNFLNVFKCLKNVYDSKIWNDIF